MELQLKSVSCQNSFLPLSKETMPLAKVLCLQQLQYQWWPFTSVQSFTVAKFFYAGCLLPYVSPVRESKQLLSSHYHTSGKVGAKGLDYPPQAHIKQQRTESDLPNSCSKSSAHSTTLHPMCCFQPFDPSFISPHLFTHVLYFYFLYPDYLCLFSCCLSPLLGI